MEFTQAYNLFVNALTRKSLSDLRRQLKQLITLNEKLARKCCLSCLCSFTEERECLPFIREIAESQLFQPPYDQLLLSNASTLIYNITKRSKSSEEVHHLLALLASISNHSNGEILDFLNDDGHSALHLSVINGDERAARILLAQGSDCNNKTLDGHSALSLSIAYGYNDLVPLILPISDVNTEDSDHDTPLMFAAWNKQPETVSALIQRGANVNAMSRHGSTALWNAVYQSSPECVLLLLSHNARMDVKCEGTHLFLDESQSISDEHKVTKLYGRHRRSLLWVAVERIGVSIESMKVLSTLLEAGYDVTKDHWLRQMTTSQSNECPKTLEQNHELHELLSFFYKRPQNLRDLCRNALRRCQWSNCLPFDDWLQKLEIPARIRDFFTLSYISL